ncbi:MAG: aspartate/glutamate racemase family protein [Butyricicoccus sp.]
MKKLGILMLDTHFPRIPGDVGNEKSFSFPIVKKIVTGASTRRVVLEGDSSLLRPFLDAARELEAEGVAAITTSCGFLAMFQRELAAAVNIPVFTSALLQAALLAPMLKGGQAVGILTADGRKLGERHFQGVGITHVPKVVYGMEGTAFGEVFVGDSPMLHRATAEREMRAVARRMVEEHPEIGPVVLECTNMPPYARAVADVTGRPVYDITTLAETVMHSLTRTEFA